jgi:hypothetical protein
VDGRGARRLRRSRRGAGRHRRDGGAHGNEVETRTGLLDSYSAPGAASMMALSAISMTTIEAVSAAARWQAAVARRRPRGRGRRGDAPLGAGPSVASGGEVAASPGAPPPPTRTVVPPRPARRPAPRRRLRG